MVTFEEIQAAQATIHGAIDLTPCKYSGYLSRLTGAEVHLKLENLQKTGSFKIRGALNKLSSLTPEERSRGVIAASAGNHAQGVARAAQQLGIRATVLMPEPTPMTKVEATKFAGAEVILEGAAFDDALRVAQSLARERGLTMIHPFDDPAVIAGQGTVGLEMLAQLPELGAVVVPVGGGGLISGIAITLKQLRPTIRVIGVQVDQAASAVFSRRAGQVMELTGSKTIADGIAVKRVGDLTFAIMERYVDDLVSVSDDDIAAAMLIYMERIRIVVEGAGAASLAALVSHKVELDGVCTGVVVSGGNIDVQMVAKIIEKGLVRTDRLLGITVELLDVPGALGRLATLLGQLRANILQISHDRLASALPLDRATVEISLDTRNREHQEKILEALDRAGYVPRRKG
ncbi:MAG: threonine ammonia-lyase [Nitrospinae bacterium]|nr:threonine ammonia-lyase [Nitrospinota bacterium]